MWRARCLTAHTSSTGRKRGRSSCAQVFWELHWPYWLATPVNELKVLESNSDLGASVDLTGLSGRYTCSAPEIPRSVVGPQ